MSKKKIVLLAVIIALLVAGNIYFACRAIMLKSELSVAQSYLQKRTDVTKILEFYKMFVEKVLETKSEVDFETRLKLENNVRELNNPKILDKWQKFVNSKTELEAQAATVGLLKVIVEEVEVLRDYHVR
ncbi:MAG: hypothetical protein PHY40_01300 [Patescibacteria group bacterium]|jgi:hypothetical protein|nr:hypothetical protein [Patescibacteria group bacterium]